MEASGQRSEAANPWLFSGVQPELMGEVGEIKIFRLDALSAKSPSSPKKIKTYDIQFNHANLQVNEWAV